MFKRLGITGAGVALVLGPVVVWAIAHSAVATGPVHTLTTVDSTDSAGYGASMTLDASGNPVVSYTDEITFPGSLAHDLLLLHCGNPSCTAGNTTSFLGQFAFDTSLALDASGNPVISFYEPLYQDLAIVHCNDPDCLGGDESMVRADTAGDAGWGSSLTLDASGWPVVTYRDADYMLRLLHCNDPNCAGRDDSIEVLGPMSFGAGSDLVLDATGYPLIAYAGSSGLVVTHCNDPLCSGRDESVVSVDSRGGQVPSLRLDSAGKPVVAYESHSSSTPDEVSVLHCGNTDCSSGNSIAPIGTGYRPFLALLSKGNPFVTAGAIKVFECQDLNCGAVHTYSTWAGFYGLSMVLDASENPIVAIEASGSGLRIAHCGNHTCGNQMTSPDQMTYSSHTSIALDAAGNPVISYSGFGRLVLVHCADPDCVLPVSRSEPDQTAYGVTWTSEALDNSGHPVIAYGYTTLAGEAHSFRIIHCNDPNCVGNDESIAVADPAGEAASTGGLVLDAAGNPVVAYDALGLRVLHCGNPDCTAGNTISTAVTGSDPSIKIDAAGFPVVSYYGGYQERLRVMHCNDPGCLGGDESIQAPGAPSVGSGDYSSLELDASGNPVVSFRDEANQDLSLVHCNDPDCSGGDESVVSPDGPGDVGLWTSLALDSSGNPVVSYFDRGNSDLLILHCGNAGCTSNNTIAGADRRRSEVGEYSSLALDAFDRPVVSYLDHQGAYGSLNVLHCSDPTCLKGLLQNLVAGPATQRPVPPANAHLVKAAPHPHHVRPARWARSSA